MQVPLISWESKKNQFDIVIECDWPYVIFFCLVIFVLGNNISINSVFFMHSDNPKEHVVDTYFFVYCSLH
jgi:hypothetical protein